MTTNSELSRAWIPRSHRVHARNRYGHHVYYVMGHDEAMRHAQVFIDLEYSYVAVFTPRGVALREWYNGTEKPRVQQNGDTPPF